MKFGVIGAGSWGVALSQALSSISSNEILIYSRKRKIANEINTHSYYKFPDIILNLAIKATNNLADLARSEVIFIATPAQTVKDVLIKIGDLSFPQPIVLCSKGIEQDSLLLLSELVEKILPRSKYAILSGPNFAYEVAKGLPTIASLASNDENLLQKLLPNIHSNNFKIYPCKDVISIEILGAVKNVLAIACGIAHGLNLGENTRASIISRGFREIASLCGKGW